MNWLSEYWPFRSNPSVTIVLGGAGILLFAGFIAYCLRRNSYDYLPGLILLCVGCASVLLLGLLGASLSSHPATVGGIWRLLNGLLLLAGWILYERARRRRSL